MVIGCLFFQLHLCAQDLEQKVSIEADAVVLEVLLQEVGERYNLSFSYGGHLPGLEQKLSIRAEKMPLNQFLSLLLAKVALTYKVIGGYVVLRKLEPQTQVVLPEQAGRGAGRLPRSYRDQSVQQDTVQRMVRIAPTVGFQVYVPEWSMPTRIILEEAQPPVRHRQASIRIGPVFSKDFMQLDLQSSYADKQQVDAGLSYSIGSVCWWNIREHLALEWLFLYRQKVFTLRYGLETGVDPLGLPLMTEAVLAYLDIPINIHVRLYQFKQIAVGGIVGLYGSHLLEKGERTWMDDGRMFPATGMLVSTLSRFLWGMQAGIGFHYDLNSRVSFYLSPVYQHNLNKFKKGTQQIRLQEFVFRTGFRFSL
ncbi:STN domain-containing protein [Cesiribacter sp. SM1]|uniref:STN domain-containing protein n=1 Tax=Cesiribacter sp. SM1 TaxID=2861196 RepID=UPI001CD20548|nr:STN domain-containing protein [Cesiribacter sp. SM1]